MSDIALQKNSAGPGLIREWIDRAARRHPDKPYIVAVEDGRSIGFRAFRDLTRRIAAFLRRQGIGTNDRIALLAGNSIEHVACYVGVMAYGATICTVHVEMNRRHLGRILAQLKPRHAIHDDDLGLDGLALDGFGLDGFAAAAAVPRLALGRWDRPGAGTFFDAVGRSEPSDGGLPATTERDDGVIFFTSGTSERPKGVVLSYREQVGNVEPMTDGFGISGSDRIYDYRSFNWASAQLLGVLAPLCRGATLVMAKKFSATRFFDDVRAHGVTVAAGNPTTIGMLLNTGATLDSRDVPTLRFVTSSSAPLIAEQWRRFEERFGIAVAQGYGSSETAWIATNPARERRRPAAGVPAHRRSPADDRRAAGRRCRSAARAPPKALPPTPWAISSAPRSARNGS